MVPIGRLHDLNPLDGNLVLLTFMLCLVDWKIRAFSETVYAESPIDVELKLLLDLVSDLLKDVLPEILGVVWDLRLELAGVLVDALNVFLIEVDLEVVGEKLELFTLPLWISDWLLWE